jgi:hypothetical protein
MSMIPECPVAGTSALPAGAAFWMPKPDEISEEGFSFFRDVWLIRGVRIGDAREVIEEERRIVDVIDRLSADADHFEEFAAIAETGGIDDPANELTLEEYSTLSTVVSDIPAELGGLELGVAGLVHALASVRILPAASCRSHPERSWSEAPVVLFAATEFRALALEPLVAEAGCTFTIDPARRELLCVRGQSITRTMALAELVLEHRKDFVQRRPRRVVQKRSAPKSEQGALF